MLEERPIWSSSIRIQRLRPSLIRWRKRKNLLWLRMSFTFSRKISIESCDFLSRHIWYNVYFAIIHIPFIHSFWGNHHDHTYLPLSSMFTLLTQSVDESYIYVVSPFFSPTIIFLISFLSNFHSIVKSHFKNENLA